MLPTLWRGNAGFVPVRPLGEVGRHMEELFNRLMGRSLLPFEGDFEELRAWDFEVEDKENEIVVKAEVPGFDPAEIEVQVQNGILTIHAEKKQKKGEEEAIRTYRRSVTLPCGVMEEKATATYKHGVLKLHLPKAETCKPKVIPVVAK